MKKIVWLVAILSVLFMISVSLAEEGEALTGDYAVVELPDTFDSSAKKPTGDGFQVGLSSSALENLPVISKGLAEKVAEKGENEDIRVIVYLAYQPQDKIAKKIKGKYAREKQSIKKKLKEIKSKYSSVRDSKALADAVNYSDEVLALSLDDQMKLKELHKGNEALALIINNEMAAALATEMAPFQEIVEEVVIKQGGEVEFSLTVVNALVAKVPISAIAEIAALAEVRRIVEDGLMNQHLDIADDATLVTSTSAGLGLWDNGFAGGAYDAAVLDTGIDLNHPALAGDTYRTNFYSWYLAAATTYGAWNDEVSVDDLQGHGSHVMGIVASYGSGGYDSNLGMAHDVEKAITLKAGFRKTDGNGSMYNSDAMHLVDRALYHAGDLQSDGTSAFNDDVDGINLSFGGETVVDETDYSRFWDSVVSSSNDLVVTISAGNSGPNNSHFNSPACNYNAITVANVYDVNTADRDDDYIRYSSTRGPTEDGRRKPDIAAPGTAIVSCNNDWETENDFISKSGTSMSAPMVLGVAMDLMDAGVTDELEIKALLINTAQKNNSAINFESDADGWSESYGWGYMNAWAAYYHRDDVWTLTVNERPADSSSTGSWYKLLKGQMRDESGGEGRDRVTIVWNRHADYNATTYPATFYSLSDLDLKLFSEADNVMIDYDQTTNDNVHQVRIGAGASPTDVIVRAFAWSTNFMHGDNSESFAIATEENFDEVDFPTLFGGIGSWHHEMEPGEEADFEFWLRNDSEIACHTNNFTPILESGWTLVSGPAVFAAGSIAGGGATSIHAVWRLKAPSSPIGANFKARHTHNSYGLAGPAFDWGMGVNVVYDTTTPSPNPMTFAIPPAPNGSGSLWMKATRATDVHAVEYRFWTQTEGHSSWQASPEFVVSGLEPNTQYGYWVQARDTAIDLNQTDWSLNGAFVYTAANLPGACIISNISLYSLDVTPDPNGNPGLTECAIMLSDQSTGSFYYLDAAGGDNGYVPVWRSFSQWGTLTLSGLTPDSEYCFSCIARNQDGIETSLSILECYKTPEFDPDFNHDGDVDGDDLAGFINDYYDWNYVEVFTSRFGTP